MDSILGPQDTMVFVGHINLLNTDIYNFDDGHLH